MTRLSCPGADCAFTPRWRDDEAPTEDEPLDAPDHTDTSPCASGRDRAASLEAVQFVAGSAVLISAILYCNHLSHVLYPN